MLTRDESFKREKKIKPLLKLLLLCIVFSSCQRWTNAQAAQKPADRLVFNSVPDFPNKIGVAGPIVGVVGDSLIVAGGANFAASNNPKLWELPKLYHDKVWILNRTKKGEKATYQWQKDSARFRLSKKIAYSAVVSTPWGVLCMGGENQDGPQNRAFLLTVSTSHDGTVTVAENDLGVPDLPVACTGGGAAIVGDYVYLVAGQALGVEGKKAASRTVWRLNLTTLKKELKTDVNQQTERWEKIVSWPNTGPPRMFPLVTSQHDGFKDCLYVIGGRHFPAGSDVSDLTNLKFLSDAWSFDPSRYNPQQYNQTKSAYQGASPWQRLADSPVSLSSGTAVPFGPAHIIIPTYATGRVLHTALQAGIKMKDFDHPGFPKTALAYHTVTDTWVEMGSIPANQVTTPAVRWDNEILIVSGEIRPRVRSNKAWRIGIREKKSDFGFINMTVVVMYLLAMIGIGVYFSFRNKSTDDYFRGGKSIPWWAAGCSIFATMLSSITFMAVPAKAFAQDWVYAFGNLLVLAVAPIAIYVALPFFRRIDATSAYEYLEKRFNRTARLIGSGSFTLFHIFRIGVVLALASLALASVTPMTPTQCVFVMGILSIIYCTLGGIEAVIWTDTLQTGILLGGAVLCLVFALQGSDPGSFSAAVDAGKFHLVNVDFGSTSFTTMAIWVVIFGGLGQNLASYTADQAVIQRYMTTPDQKQAALSIWLNGLMAVPAGAIFFGMGTAFWMFYRSHPEKLDPTIAADRIMPLFISNELPVGLAGLVVAGIFAAAQSTVSTSMNSGATTIVTDFFRSFNLFKTDKGYLWSARLVTLVMGIVGTAAGLFFVDPSIKSLFDQFIGILGMFLGVLAGLFALGATTRRASGVGSLIGAMVSILVMLAIVLANKDKTIAGIDFRAIFDALGTQIYQVNGYLYAIIGIVICYVVGYGASFIFPNNKKSLAGLTLWDKEL